MLNLNQLRVFYHAAKNLNYTVAAGELFITQPAVTAQMKAFEESCNLKLFRKKDVKVYWRTVRQMPCTGSYFLRNLSSRTSPMVSGVPSIHRTWLSGIRCASNTVLIIATGSILPGAVPRSCVRSVRLLRRILSTGVNRKILSFRTHRQDISIPM